MEEIDRHWTVDDMLKAYILLTIAERKQSEDMPDGENS